MFQASAAQVSLPASPSSQGDDAYQGSPKEFSRNQSETSLGTVHHTHRRNISLDSAGSYGSFGTGELRVRNATIPPSESASASSLYLAESFKGSLDRRRSSKQASHKSSWGTEIPVPPLPSDPSTFLLDAGPLEDIDLNVTGERVRRGSKTMHTYSFNADPYVSMQVTQEMMERSIRDQENLKPSNIVTKTATPITHPFRRWISTLRPKRSKMVGPLKVRQERWSLDDFEESSLPKATLPGRRTISSHRRGSSWSSSSFVEAINSARAGIGALNVAPSSRRNRKSILRSSDVSSRVSRSGNRTSVDSGHGSINLMDEAAWARGIQRRRTLEELVNSEEGYISDLKVLVNVVPRSML